MTRVFHARPYGRFTQIEGNLRRKKLHRTNQDLKNANKEEFLTGSTFCTFEVTEESILRKLLSRDALSKVFIRIHSMLSTIITALLLICDSYMS